MARAGESPGPKSEQRTQKNRRGILILAVSAESSGRSNAGPERLQEIPFRLAAPWKVVVTAGDFVSPSTESWCMAAMSDRESATHLCSILTVTVIRSLNHEAEAAVLNPSEYALATSHPIPQHGSGTLSLILTGEG
jgi:hypothetical protein